MDLESLLVASTQALLMDSMPLLGAEALEAAKSGPAIVRLPRELNPNKRYSWMQKKDEPMFSMKCAMEGMDTMELDYRMKLAELQRRYKGKQRELAKLQKRRDYELGKGYLLPGELEMGDGAKRKARSLTQDEEDETESVSVKVKRRNRMWDEQDASSSFSHESHGLIKFKKKRKVSEQDQLATKLHQTLSLTKLKSPFKFADGLAGKQKCHAADSYRHLASHEDFLGKDGRKALYKSIGASPSLLPSKESKNKMAAKSRKLEPSSKIKGRLKASHSPARSEVSSYSYNTDTDDEDVEDLCKNEWPRRSTSSLAERPGPKQKVAPTLYGLMSKKSKASLGGSIKQAKRLASATGTVSTQRALDKKKLKHFALLLAEAEARTSFTDSSEDSFNQG